MPWSEVKCFTTAFLLPYDGLVICRGGGSDGLGEAEWFLRLAIIGSTSSAANCAAAPMLVDVEPKVFDLLAFLVQHRDRVVSKDDLLQAIWDGRIVSESALTTRINAVRRALGDDGAAQRLVRTFTRKGIRFVGDVTEMPDQARRPPCG